MADDPKAAARADAIKKLDEQEKTLNEAYNKRPHGKPTPTQREADLMKLGVFDPDTREDDGSGPDPHSLQGQADRAKADAERKALLAQQDPSYKSREVKAKVI